MKKLTILIFVTLISVNLFAQTSHPDCPEWAEHPIKVKENYQKNGYKIIEYKPFSIGEGTPEKVRIIRKKLTLPIGAQDIKSHAYFAADGNGCLGLNCWVEGLDYDHNWGSMHMVEEGFNDNGNQYIVFEFRNWSNCDSRIGYCFVAYKL